ncbi:MAG: YbhB/YbcL family Raf kinase inhibitor-like protein [Steroidobacterales bacterium]
MAETHSDRVSMALAAIAAGALTLASAAVAADGAFTLHSPAVAPNSTLSNDQVYSGFGCSGRNISPALAWRGAPKGTRSFALTVYDPDAPTGSGWWHWLVYNIPASVSELPTGAGSAGGTLPAGAVQGHTDFGTAGFGGACPPAGDKPHRYIFTVYALKSERIDVPDAASAAMVGFMIHANTLAKASITAHYGR